MSDNRSLGVDEAEDAALFAELAAHGSRRVRNRLVERHMGLAAHIAKRYARPDAGEEDVRQVAMIGLVKAVDRFDPSHGAAFSSFAGRTIEGEIKRYFRDKSWTVRVPRGAKEMHLLVRRATDELSQRDGRAPTVPELADHLGVDREDVLRGLAATAAYRVGTLDGSSDDESGPAPADRHSALASEDAGFDHSLERDVVADLLASLPEREREIVRLRFFEERSQSEIAAIVGVSQMHVSRLLRRSFEQMRERLAET